MMLPRPPFYLAVASLIFFILATAGCDSEEIDIHPDAATDVAGDVGDNEVDPYDIASGPLEVGYARVAAPWRVGAKPGQVGTSATDEMESELMSRLAELVPIVNGGLPPAEMLEQMTQWNLEVFEEELEATEHGEYARLFEPGLGIEQPPDVKALVIRRGDLKTAVVRADIYLMHEFIHRRVATLVEAQTGLGRDEIFLAGTHNHSAAQPSHPSPGVWSLADGFDPRHFVYITHKIADALLAADADLQPARLRAMRTQYDEVQFNIIGPSTIEMAPETGADAERETIFVGYPRDYFDADLDLLYFDTADEPHEPIALVFSLGMHPESLPSGHGLISGDFPLHTEKHLRRRLDIPAMWLPGTLGDIEPDKAENNEDHNFWRHSFGALHQLSHTLADGVEAAFTEMLDDPSIEPELEPIFRNATVDIGGTDDFPLPTTAYLMGIRIPSPRVLHGSSLIRLHATRLGDALLLGIPAEVTTDLSFNIKSRLGTDYDEVHQGYIFPENPDWVAQRVAQNFSTTTAAPDHRAPFPIVTSMVNGYMGYIVSRWEYENREHYRMNMTSHGPDTADHVARHLVELVDAMMGGAPMEVDYPDWLEDDLAGVDELMDYFEGLEEEIVGLSRQIPAADDESIAAVLAGPQRLDADAIDDRLATIPAVTLHWAGATADSPPPTVIVERADGDDWHPITRGPDLATHLLYDGQQTWQARWFPAYDPVEVLPDDELRFRVAGTFRSDEPGSTDGHPIWDPDGADQHYELTSQPFTLDELQF